MQLYNSLTRKKEFFVPQKEKEVLMYVCGITPYDTTHLGHAFTYVFFDALFRYLTFKGYKVFYTQNVTDIDADILKKAKEVNENWKKLGEFWTKRFLSDMESLNIIRPTNYVKATDSITMMINIIEVLLKKGFAYKRNGTVYFEVNKDKSYGKLSHLNRKQMLILSKERGNDPDDPQKKDPLDFVLWQKCAPGEPFWESPWGKGRPASRRSSSGGRPGWHIECSAMVKQYLGDTIDIHGGGRDLIFPHHESEITQSENYTGKKPYSKLWLHTAMLLYEGEKMSKSLGNLVMVVDLLKKYSSNAIRFILLSHHYREPWEFHEEELITAEESLKLIKTALKIKSKKDLSLPPDEYFKKINEELDNDMNTPKALSSIINLANKIIEEKNSKNIENFQNNLQESLKILGFAV